MAEPKLFIKLILLLMILISSAFGYSPQYADSDKSSNLRWKTKKIPIKISSSITDEAINIKSNTDILATIKNSLKQWENVANVEFELSYTEETNVSAKGSSGDGISLITIAPTTENLLLFNGKIDDVSAITRLFYTPKGEIKEADIVLNPVMLFTTDGTFGSFDLEATLTHEIGHFLGLGHSQIIGSTMHSHQGKNGVYNLPGYSSRTLSEDDKAGAISLYGKNTEDDSLYAKIEGKLDFSEEFDEEQVFIWAEESKTGKVVAGVFTNYKGNFEIVGLPQNLYKIYVQDKKSNSNTIYLSEVDLRKVTSETLRENIEFTKKDFEVQYIGFNGQLSNLAVPVIAGNTYVIYIGGKNLDPKEFEIGFVSDNFVINRQSIIEHDYGKDISVISFEVQIKDETSIGEYSFYLKNKQQQQEIKVGGLTVENSINSQTINIF